MATESPLIHDGSQTTLSTAFDARRSSITGSTLPGPNGSGQFLLVALSTQADRQVRLTSTSTADLQAYGILQGTPGPGQAADVGIFGISKAVAGTTTIVDGSRLGISSTLAGAVNLWSTGAGTPVGRSLEAVSAVGQVITIALGGFASLGASTL
jgi:hypothetical protein